MGGRPRPGSLDWLAPGAQRALEEADVILGYHTYLRQIEAIAPQVPRESSGMRHEIERAKKAWELAAWGKHVAVVSGGDAGIYGMAGLILELQEGKAIWDIHVEILPGISALNAAASLLGAPLMNDFAVISLSDYLVPLEVILKRLECAIQGDFVICLYNPRSHLRTRPYALACNMLLEHCGKNRPVGVVQAAFRAEQRVHCVPLGELSNLEIGMDTILLVGSSATRILNGKLITPRGYPVASPVEEEQ